MQYENIQGNAKNCRYSKARQLQSAYCERLLFAIQSGDIWFESRALQTSLLRESNILRDARTVELNLRIPRPLRHEDYITFNRHTSTIAILALFTVFAAGVSEIR